MNLQNYLPTSAADYIECFRSIAALTNSALNYIEDKNDWVSASDRNKSLMSVAESVNTIASLRGDSGAFYSARPEGLVEYQQEMYVIENQLRARLVSLGYTYPPP